MPNTTPSGRLAASRAATLAVALAALLALTSATPAQADSARIDDGVGDVWKQVFEKGSSDPTYVETDKRANIDIQRVRVRHLRTRVSATTTFSALRKDVTMSPFVQVLVRTDRLDDFGMFASLYKDGGEWRTEGYVYPIGGTRPGPLTRGEEGCAAHVDVDWQKDTVTVSARRACFKKPTWIRAHVDDVGYQSDGEDFFQYVDNAHNGKANKKGWTGRIKRG